MYGKIPIPELKCSDSFFYLLMGNNSLEPNVLFRSFLCAHRVVSLRAAYAPCAKLPAHRQSHTSMSWPHLYNTCQSVLTAL